MIQNKEGHMPRNLIKYRDDVDKQFFSLVKRKYGLICFPLFLNILMGQK